MPYITKYFLYSRVFVKNLIYAIKEIKIYKILIFKKILRFSIFSLTIVAIIYSIYWLIQANLLEEKFRKFSNGIGDRNISISFENINITGFPFSFSANLTNPILIFGVTQGPNDNRKYLKLRNNLISVQIYPWNYSSYIIKFGKEYKFDFYNSIQQFSFRGVTEKFNISLIFDRKFDAFELDFDIAQFKLQTENLVTLFSAKNLMLSLSKPIKLPLPNANDEIKSNYKLVIRSEGSTLAKIFKLPVSKMVKLIFVKIKIFGNLNIPVNLENLKSWLKDGGIIEVEDFGIIDTVFESKLNGTVSLDENLQILAAFVAEVEGLPFILQNLSDNSHISIDAANKLAFLLKLMSQTSPNGTMKNRFSMTVQDRQLFIGLTPVIGLPLISW